MRGQLSASTIASRSPGPPQKCGFQNHLEMLPEISPRAPFLFAWTDEASPETDPASDVTLPLSLRRRRRGRISKGAHPGGSGDGSQASLVGPRLLEGGMRLSDLQLRDVPTGPVSARASAHPGGLGSS